MPDRIGVCSKCGGKFKIPPTFKGSKAKCKKCGGVVEIPPAEAEQKAPAPAPKAKPAAATGEKAKTPGQAPRKSSMASRHAAGKRGGRKRGAKGEEEKSNTMMWGLIVGGVSVVAIIVICIIAFSGDDEPVVPDYQPEVVKEEPELEPDPVEPEPEPETVEPEPEVVKTEPEPEPVKEEIDPIISFELFPPLIGCSQERFDELTQYFRDGILYQELPPRKRRPLKKKWEEALTEEGNYDVLPVILNEFNNLDLLDLEGIVLAYNVADCWNKYTGSGYVDIAVRSDPDEERRMENLSWNHKTINSMLKIWRDKYVGNEAKQQEIFEKIEKARRKQKERDARKEDEDE